MEKKGKEIQFEKFISGAIAYFGTIDNIDLRLLIEDFEDQTSLKIVGIKEFLKSDGKEKKYINNSKSGVWELKTGLSLDSLIDTRELETSARNFLQITDILAVDYLKLIAEEEENNYFNSIDHEKYKEKKKAFLEKKENEVINTANVLLLSDNSEEYEELIKHGFAYVSWFPSLIRANAYFNEHPEDLLRFHLIIVGENKVCKCTNFGNYPLKNTINKMRWNTPLINANLCHYGTLINSQINDPTIPESYMSYSTTYKEIFDAYLFCLSKSEIIKKKGEVGNFIIEDKVTSELLPLPKKLSDLKILFMDHWDESLKDYTRPLAKKLGLNITFIEDNNNALGLQDENNMGVNYNLGNYDIIIGSQLYSENLINLNKESTEQCKDTGRQMTLLALYEFFSWPEDSYGDIKLYYRFGGNLAPDSDEHKLDIKSPRTSFNIPISKNRYGYEGLLSDRLCIITSAIHEYNDALIKSGNYSLEDLYEPTEDGLRIKSAYDYNKMYLDYQKKLEKQIRLAFENNKLIARMDNIKKTILEYIYYKDQGMIDKDPEELNVIITKNNDDKKVIKIIIKHDGINLCSLIIDRQKTPKDHRKVITQRIKDDWTLSNPKNDILTINSTFELDFEQKEIIQLVDNKINELVKPIVEEIRPSRVSKMDINKKYEKK